MLRIRLGLLMRILGKATNSMSTRLAVLFGGVSVEHEVSIITALSLMKEAQKKYQVLPIYVDKTGQWWTGDVLFDSSYFKTANLSAPKDLTPFTLSPNPKDNDLDAAILCFHGRFGEGGGVQGLLELAQIPYQGPNMTSAGLCFDKIHTRQVLAAENIPQPEFLWFTYNDWQTKESEIVERIEAQLNWPVFVKPAGGGSTVGVTRADDKKGLKKAIETALQYDNRILVEQAINDCLEINVAILGMDGSVTTSVPEQPIKADEWLSYADKYERGGGKKTGMASAKRRIPAPISEETTAKVQQLARDVFRVLGCSGVVRVDCFVNPSTDEMFVIEPNTIPGSMSYYLFEASGLKYSELIDRLISIAESKERLEKRLIHSYQSNILEKNGE